MLATVPAGDLQPEPGKRTLRKARMVTMAQPRAAFLIGMNKTLNQRLEPKQACSTQGVASRNASANEERSTSLLLNGVGCSMASFQRLEMIRCFVIG